MLKVVPHRMDKLDMFAIQSVEHGSRFTYAYPSAEMAEFVMERLNDRGGRTEAELLDFNFNTRNPVSKPSESSVLQLESDMAEAARMTR